MKASKQQAQAVRSYLSGIGCNISHVQALEVIARGQGLRSRHVKSTVESAPSAPPNGAATMLANALALLLTDVENVCDFGMPFTDEHNNMHVSVMAARKALASWNMSGGQTEAAPSMSAGEMLRLKYGEDNEHPDYPRGDWLFVSSKLRTTQTYWDWVATRLESVENEELFQEVAQAPVQVALHPVEAKALAETARSLRIKKRFLTTRQGPAQRNIAVNLLLVQCPSLYQSKYGALRFLVETVTPGLLPAEEIADAIKAEYLASRCHADDVAIAISRLMNECGSLFGDDRSAWEFIMEEDHEDREDFMYVVQVDSALHGTDIFVYFTEEERRAAVIRLMDKAVRINDGVPRDYYFTEIDSDIEKNSPEYEQALETRELVGQITDQSVVFFQGERIGTIAEITEDELTLYSWIDDKP
jgi:hypothetical protein